MSEPTFEETIKKHSGYLYSLSYRLTGSADNAADIMQDTCLKAFQNWDSLEDKERSLPWLRKICINTFIDSTRKKEAKLASASGFNDFVLDHSICSERGNPDQELLAEEGVRTVQSQCFSIFTQDLPLYQRMTFVLIDIFQIGIGETARLIGKSKSSTKSHLYRARKSINQATGRICGLINVENYCRCSTWLSFADDMERKREYLKAIVENVNMSETEEKVLKKKMISLFNTLPEIRPFTNWFSEVKKVL